MYYGDEIGMGDNIYLGDRNGVRTPMQWSADRNAGFSRANPHQLYFPVIIDPEYHYETVNVEAQQANPDSLLWWTKRLLALRKRYRAFGRGSIEFLRPENGKVLTFLRRYEDECVLIVANLSRFAQYVELDLSAFQGLVPVEMFGQVSFPSIGEQPYLLTLGPHAFYWFSLEPQQYVEGEEALTADSLPLIHVPGKWESLFHDDAKKQLEAQLARYLAGRRWFAGKAHKMQAVSLTEIIPVPYDTFGAFFTILQVAYVGHEAETYVLPLAVALGANAEHLQADSPQAVIARVKRPEKTGEEVGVLYDAMWDGAFCQTLLDAFARRRRWKGSAGELCSVPSRAFRALRKTVDSVLPVSVMKTEQSNTSIAYGETFMLKLYRRMAAGQNPDAEIGQFLTERAAFPHTPPLAGRLEYRPLRGEPSTLALLQGFVPNQGDTWQYTLDALRRYYEVALAQPPSIQLELPERSVQHPLDGLEQELPQLAYELIGPYIESARLLGQRTAELHRALASVTDDPAFTPEPFSTLYQRSLYQSMRNQLLKNFQLLRQQLKRMPASVQDEANKALALEQAILNRFQAVTQTKITALRTRHHGDYHLGQVLYTGKDFVIIDFEGEPARSLTERRIKRSPLREVAGMLRSFHYAAYTGVFEQVDQSGAAERGQVLSVLEPWAGFWYGWVATTFLQAYLDSAEQASFLPQTQSELRILLDIYVLEKAVYELAYELNNRPDWLRVPLQGITQLLTAEH
jgi:maltose alpha-D-glucosyltransferase/alpha-amylase